MRSYIILLLIGISCRAYPPPLPYTFVTGHPLSWKCLPHDSESGVLSRCIHSELSDNAPGILMHFLTTFESAHDACVLSEEEMRRPEGIPDHIWLATFIRNKKWHMASWGMSQLLRIAAGLYNDGQAFPIHTLFFHGINSAVFCGELLFEEGCVLGRLVAHMSHLWNEAGSSWEREQFLRTASLVFPPEEHERVACAVCHKSLAQCAVDSQPFIRTCSNDQHVVCRACWENERALSANQTLQCVVSDCSGGIVEVHQPPSRVARSVLKVSQTGHQVAAVTCDVYLYVSLAVVAWLAFMQWADTNLMLSYT